MNLLFSFYSLSFPFLTLVSIPPRVLTEPQPCSFLHITHSPSTALFITSVSCSCFSYRESFAIGLAFYLVTFHKYYVIDIAILLYTPHVSTSIPQPVLVNTPPSLLNSPQDSDLLR